MPSMASCSDGAFVSGTSGCDWDIMVLSPWWTCSCY
jgi:hypothetical protein